MDCCPCLANLVPRRFFPFRLALVPPRGPPPRVAADASDDTDAIALNVKWLLRRGFKRGNGVLLAAGAGGDFPVLTIAESREHPHNVARESFVEYDGVGQPRPAPRFSRTDSCITRGPARAGEHTDEILAEAGFSSHEIAKLEQAGAINRD